MIVTLFRSRLRQGIRSEYEPTARRMLELARSMPGFVSFKTFTAEDGERISVIEFESDEQLKAWREHPEHLQAQELGRTRFFEEYHVQVLEPLRDTRGPG